MSSQKKMTGGANVSKTARRPEPDESEIMRELSRVALSLARMPRPNPDLVIAASPLTKAELHMFAKADD